MAKQISALPTAPSTQRPATFNVEADAFVSALSTFVSEANALATEAATNAQRSEDANATAQSAKESAQTSAQTASEAKEAAARSASQAASSAQTAAQIKTQTQEIKQSAQESLAAIAAAAQSSAQAARQSEQAAEQTKAELQTATNTLEQMKSIVKDGFIDDTAQSETKTYSSKKISQLNEALSADVTQKLDQAGKEIRTAAMSGAMPSAYESDLAMWDYMEQSRAACGKARFFKDWVLGVDRAVKGYTIYPGLDSKIKNNYYVSPSENITAILDGSGEVIAAIAQNGAIYKQDGTMTSLNTTNPDGVSISASNKVNSVAGKFVLYFLGGDGVAVFGLSSDDKVLKYLYKTSVADIGSGYVFHDVLVVNKYEAPQKTYKITDTGISEISGVELPASVPQYPNSEPYVLYMPFYKDFLLSKNALIKADGTVKSIRICGEILGFLGGTPYLLQRVSPTSGVLYRGGNNEYLYTIFDVENGARCVLLPLGKEPLSAYVEDGYTYIVFKDGVAKIPAKYLTGANYKGE